MTNPYTTPTPPPLRPAPRWARKRYVLPALALAFFLGIGAGSGGGDDDTTTNAKPAAARPTPTETVTATATVTQSPETEPAPTVTATKTIRATRTVMAQPPAGTDSDDSVPVDVYYANCTEAREADAAPILRGEPGYASHLDRDNDGVACDT
ncbi:excalibur calcium-binding domain-containing protein [Streptomyces sp. KR55]|uniref:excalibur calcium-binding domain-containing protein n=1 Tax=Streptomyces sp. KR55 TaxID=3457425 RepID=UPI003FD5AF9F